MPIYQAAKNAISYILYGPEKRVRISSIAKGMPQSAETERHHYGMLIPRVSGIQITSVEVTLTAGQHEKIITIDEVVNADVDDKYSFSQDQISALVGYVGKEVTVRTWKLDAKTVRRILDLHLSKTI